MLRVVGAMADELGATNIAVLEGLDSFIVRFTVGMGSETREMRFDEILDAFHALRDHRTILGTAEQGPYQDLMRAVGFDMEEVHAHNLLLAEAGDHFLVTYQTSESTSVAPRTHHAVLTPSLVREVLDRAHGRRGSHRFHMPFRTRRRSEDAGSELASIVEPFEDSEDEE
jgi:hypothetical protein